MASQYGWSKEDIFNNVYPDDLYYLAEEINRRKVQDYMMQLRIVHNPFVKAPQELVNELRRASKVPKADKFDAAGFEMLKSTLAKNPKFVVKS